jgi:hypothetical protein
MVAAGEHADALEIFRETLAFYKRDKSSGLVLRTTGPSLRRSVGTLLNNIFFAIQRIDPTHFEENAKNELAKELYDDLEEELALVALDMPELAPSSEKENKLPHPRRRVSCLSNQPHRSSSILPVTLSPPQGPPWGDPRYPCP